MEEIVIVIPVYNEAANLEPLYEELEKITSPLSDFRWGYLFVNDGSEDDSLQVLRRLAGKDSRVRVLDLSRNFGKEIALSAGVQHATGADAVICMDADLQHPPTLIPELIAPWQRGAEIVATIRRGTEKKPAMRRLASHLYYWLMKRISGTEMVAQTTDFRLYDRKVVGVFSQMTERDRMFRGIMDWLGFRKVYVEFDAGARHEGEAGYSYRKLWTLAINSITTNSLWPLRLTGYLGIFITAISGLLFLWMLGFNLVSTTDAYTPLAMVVVANTFLMGVVLMAIGLVALYIGNIHTEVINRPLYVVRERLNFSDNDG